MKRILPFVLAFAMGLSLFTGCSSSTANPTAAPAEVATEAPTEAPTEEPAEAAAPAEPIELVINVGPNPDSIDPAFNEAVDGATLLVHAFEGVMKLDQDSLPVPAQAESYTVSDDLLTYTFKLRDDIKWTDGQDVVADDFIYAWKRAVDPANAAPYSYMFDVVEGYPHDPENYNPDDFAVKAIDSKTVEIKLAAPCPYFLELCAFPTYFPVRQDIVEANGDKWAIDPATYVSNGAFKLTKWTADSEMIYEKNENYYDKDSIIPDTLRFVLMDDDNAMLAGFTNGELSFIDSMPNDEIDAWRDKPEFFLEGQLGTYFVCFNTEKEPFNNPKVREALSLAIDRDFICVNIGKAGQVPASAYVPTGLTGKDPTQEFRTEGGDYYDPTEAGYEANCARAKELLAEAGYPNGEGFPTFEYMFNTSTGHKLIAEALQNMWKTVLNINCTLAEQEWNVFLNTRQNGDYQVSRHGWLGDYNDPISFLDMWVTGGGNNDANYSNPDYDALIKDVKSTGDRDVRYDKMHQAEDILMKEMPVAPIYYYVDIYMKDPKMQGFYSSPLGFKFFHYAYMEE